MCIRDRYVLLKLLSTGELYAADESLERIKDVYYPILNRLIFNIFYQPQIHTPVSYTHLDVYKRQVLHIQDLQLNFPVDPHRSICLLYTSRCV